MSQILTASQTVGPFFAYGLQWEGGEQVFAADAAGQRITIRGRMFDVNAEPVGDALLEVWQRDADGRFGGPTRGSCAGFGRIYTKGDGSFRIETVMPGAAAADGGATQAPHLGVTVFARGVLHHLYTRIYFEGRAENDADPLLQLAGERAPTLVARRVADAQYEWDVVLRGERETVFFDF